MYTITYKGRVLEFENPMSLAQILYTKNLAKDYNYIVTCGLVDNNLRELSYVIDSDASLEFLDLADKDGRNIYMRSLAFVFLHALNSVEKGAHCYIEHSLSNGLFCDIENTSSPVNNHYCQAVKAKMQEIIDADIPIERIETTVKSAEDIYMDQKDPEKAKMMSYRDSENAVIYKLMDKYDYFYGFMLPSTGFLQIFDLKLYNGSLVLLGPSIKNPDKVSEFVHQPRLFSIYNSSKVWSRTIQVPSVIYLNQNIERGNYPELVRCCEAYHEKKICEIADTISSDREKRIILISGPSSSGKTSFAQRLKLQLMVNKLKPVSISVDNYFVNRTITPKDKYGRPDYESINALDLEKFNFDLKMLLMGEEVTLPIYNFVTGEREPAEKCQTVKIGPDQPVIIEGIHCLNPLMTESISYGYKFRIYVSALTPLNLDKHNRISTTDIRLIRRIIRDNTHRGNSAEDTLTMWESVNEGERKNIFVFQENADIMFNSALIYEISVMKKYVEPLLKQIKTTSANYRQAKHMLKFLQYFKDIDDERDIPPTSILREFIGGSRIVD